ncbi:hypothetical protein mRhiFer1_010255 [Rhinolophus ferrumequinum]|uniref:Uncharacterized protein n=1 Tax=Rhinolophus ferrumequinum TaxID=59479 RepID=A0A7J7X5B6_RHIFE|nr:hypothetical protein mRhiFer1_010255 [Rhinolophus ferrumequinum]
MQERRGLEWASVWSATCPQQPHASGWSALILGLPQGPWTEHICTQPPAEGPVTVRQTPTPSLPGLTPWLGLPAPGGSPQPAPCETPGLCHHPDQSAWMPPAPTSHGSHTLVSGPFRGCPSWTCRISMNIVFCKHFVTIWVS